MQGEGKLLRTDSLGRSQASPSLARRIEIRATAAGATLVCIRLQAPQEGHAPKNGRSFPGDFLALPWKHFESTPAWLESLTVVLGLRVLQLPPRPGRPVGSEKIITFSVP